MSERAKGRRSWPRTALLLALAVASAGRAAATPRTRAESAADLARGRAEGMAVSSAGRIYPAPALSLVARSDAGQVWSVAAAAAGAPYLGTGPDGVVLRLTAPDSLAALPAIEQPLVTALAAGPDGELLAAGAPGGVIYRIGSDDRPRVWAETGERYVWALAVGADGRVFAATGDRGRVLEILPSGRAEVYFDSDEEHVTSLAALPDGGLVAGGAGRGLVYRIDPEGHPLVLHDDDLPEVAALVVGADGTVSAAFVAPPAREVRPPAVRLELPDGSEVGRVDETLGALEERQGPTLRGVIEGLPPAGPAEPTGRSRSRILRIGRDGAVTEVWRSPTEAAFCTMLDGEGRLLFGTGEPARLYRVEAGGDVARLATLDPAQVTGLLAAAGRIYLATSNPAALYRLEERPGDTGTFLSRPFDAGALARWGTLRWNAEGAVGQIELYTRTGNSAIPDATWSGWSPMLKDPAGSPIDNPDGRFFQWRVRHRRGPGAPPVVSAVRVDYEPYNRPPEMLAFEVEGQVAAEPPRLRWAVADPDGDALEIEFAFRRSDRSQWTEAGTERIAPGEPDAPRRGTFVWDTLQVAEGVYSVRATASDGPGNPPGQAQTAAPRPELTVTVDRTPPRVEWNGVGERAFEVRVEDQISPVRALEIRNADRLVFTARPIDGVADSGSERYRVALPREPAAGWVLRGVDAAGNSADVPLDGGQVPH